MLEGISTIVKTYDNVSDVKCLCLYWGTEYWTCCITQCEIDWIFAMQGRSMQSSRIDWKASPSKLVVLWCFIAGFLPSSFAYIGDVPMGPVRKPGVMNKRQIPPDQSCFPEVDASCFPTWMPISSWGVNMCEQAKWSVLLNHVSILILWLLTCGNDNVQIN